MPTYEYRCKNCGREVTLTYKTYKDYDAATPACTYCDSTDLTRLISRVAIGRPAPTHDFANMSSQEMLSVMEGGDSREMGELFRQVGETVPGGMDQQFNDVTERLLGGDKPEHVEADLQSSTPPAPAKPDTSAKGQPKAGE